MLTVDVFNYSDQKVCSLYDQSIDAIGQASNVKIKTQRNGFKELSFTIPSVLADTGEDNYRLDYLKAEYYIRTNDDGVYDWFIISEPKIVHQAFSKNVTVTANHFSQTLKSKNLGLYFSDEEGNNVGTLPQLIETVLQGTGWTYVDDDFTFWEKYDPSKEKARSLVASEKTGAFALITKICDLFEARPIFDCNTPTLINAQLKVHVIPMNPFGENADPTVRPEILEQKSIFPVRELYYGYNVKNITRTENTENLVTRLYIRGAYGDADLGWCGIEELTHTVYELHCTLQANKEASFTIPMTDTLYHGTYYFTPTNNIAGSLFFSTLDPASMLYVYDPVHHYFGYESQSGTAYHVYRERQSDGSLQTVDSISSTEEQNYFSSLMDFSYYDEIGLLDEGALCRIAAYQNQTPQALQRVNDAVNMYSEYLQKISKTVGSIEYLKLKSPRIQYSAEDDRCRLTYNGIDYTTEITKKTNKYFKWRVPGDAAGNVTIRYKENGEAINSDASCLYFINPNGQSYFIKCYIDELGDYDQGWFAESTSDLDTLILSKTFSEISSIWTSDTIVYLLMSNKANGYLASSEDLELSAAENLVTQTKEIQTVHPVYYQTERPAFPTSRATDWYAWWYVPGKLGMSNSWHFAMANDTTWRPVTYSREDPNPANSDYGYHYNYKTASLYRYDGSNNWVKFSDSPSDTRITTNFGVVLDGCLQRDKARFGIAQVYSGVEEDARNPVGVPAGRYAIATPYREFITFELPEDVSDRRKIQLNLSQSLLQYGDGTNDSISYSYYGADKVYYHEANIATDNVIGYKGKKFTIRDNSQQAYVGSDYYYAVTEEADTGSTISSLMNAYQDLPYDIINGYATKVIFYDVNGRPMAYIEADAISSFTTPHGCRHIRIQTVNQSSFMWRLENDVLHPIFIIRVSDINNQIRISDDTYHVIDFLQPDMVNGITKGIYALLDDWRAASEECYGNAYAKIQKAQKDSVETELAMMDRLKNMYKEGWMEKQDYVAGDEIKLFSDGLETLKKIAQPEHQYQIGYLDTTHAQDEGVKPDSPNPNDITIMDAIHLVDEELGINNWAYVDQITRCYDQPWQTAVQINTSLTSMQQHSFTDVMAHIAEVAQQMQGKSTLFSRAKYIGGYGEILADLIEGTIDAQRVKITSTASTVSQDERGNTIYESQDGTMAMMLTGAGFCIANNKNDDGTWNWRTFGSGDGFTADMLTAGHIRANLIEAGTIVTSMLAAPVGEELNLLSNATVRIVAENAVASASMMDGVNLLRCASSNTYYAYDDTFLLNNVAVSIDETDTNSLLFKVHLAPVGCEAWATVVSSAGSISSEHIADGDEGWAVVLTSFAATETSVSVYIMSSKTSGASTKCVAYHSPKLEYSDGASTLFTQHPRDVDGKGTSLERAMMEVNPKYISAEVSNDETAAEFNIYSEIYDSITDATKNREHGFVAQPTTEHNEFLVSKGVIAHDAYLHLNRLTHATGTYTLSFFVSATRACDLNIEMVERTQEETVIELYDEDTGEIIGTSTGLKDVDIRIPFINAGNAIAVGPNWQHVVLVFALDNAASCLLHVKGSSNRSTITVRDLMVQTGNIATPWKACPDDTAKDGMNLLSNGGFENYEIVTLKDVNGEPVVDDDGNQLTSIVLGPSYGWEAQENDHAAYYVCGQSVNADVYQEYRDPLANTLVLVQESSSPHYYIGHTPTRLKDSVMHTLSFYYATENVESAAVYIGTSVDNFESAIDNDNQSAITRTNIPVVSTAQDIGDYKRFETTFESHGDATAIYIVFKPVEGQTAVLCLSRAKLEIGLHATAYSPCPADSALIASSTSSSKFLITPEHVVSTVMGSTQFIDGVTEWTETQLTQTKQEFELTVTTLKETTNGLNELLGYSTWFRFDENFLSMGKRYADDTPSPFAVQLTDQKLSFLENGSEVALLSNQELLVNKVNIQSQLRLGKLLATFEQDGSMNVDWYDAGTVITSD